MRFLFWISRYLQKSISTLGSNMKSDSQTDFMFMCMLKVLQGQRRSVPYLLRSRGLTPHDLFFTYSNCCHICDTIYAEWRRFNEDRAGYFCL